jgi:DNA-directed RNA polymerase sigma subunit (sigma70/sigma32)
MFYNSFYWRNGYERQSMPKGIWAMNFLKKYINKLQWKIYYKETGEYHPKEVYELGAWNDLIEKIKTKPLTESFPQITNERLINMADKMNLRRHIDMAAYYSVGCTFEEIAEHYNVTRERVRQCVTKYVREKKDGRI